MSPARPFDPNASLRQAIVGSIDRQIADATASGNHAALIHLAAQRSALDTGGFAGLHKHMHDAAMEQANRDAVGAKTGLINSKSGAETEEQARLAMFKKTGDVNAGDTAAGMVRMADAAAAAKAGGVHKVDPRDVDEVLRQNYPHAAAFLSVDAAGNPMIDNLHEVHAKLKALDIKGFDDPRSEFSQAAAARIRQMYNTGLPNQLFVPQNPRATYPFPNNRLPGPLDGLLRGYAAHLGNALQGHVAWDPQKDYEARRAAAGWYNSIAWANRKDDFVP